MAYRSRDRVASILAHEEADRVPYCASAGQEIRALVDSLQLSPDHRAFCLEGDFARVLIEPDPDIDAFRPYLANMPERASVSYWGIGTLPQTTEDGYHAGFETFHPLEHVNSLEQLKHYPFPQLAQSGADEGLENEVLRLEAKEYTVLGQMSQTILETAYRMRGLPQLMVDFYERPGYVEFLFEAIAERRRFQARRFAEAGVDILRIGDDIATQRSLLVSPALYRERIRPLHASIIASAREVDPDILVKYHSDGNLTPLLQDLIEIGVNIINPAQPESMDLVRIKQEFGRDLTLWGCMPVQSVFAHGSRQDVLDHLQLLMEHVAPDGGLVVEFTNFLATERSLANLRVFFEVFYEMGGYDCRARQSRRFGRKTASTSPSPSETG